MVGSIRGISTYCVRGIQNATLVVCENHTYVDGSGCWTNMDDSLDGIWILLFIDVVAFDMGSISVSVG